jgi:glucosamine-6-phosphate isomerase
MENIAMKHGAALPLRLPKTHISKDMTEMSKYCAELIAKVIKEKPDALICLPAGESALGTFEMLKIMSDRNEIDFSQAWFVALDEWLNLEDESENCSAFLLKNFYEPLHIDRSKIKFFDIHAKDMVEECKKVDQFIFDHNGIDCMLLGLGMNGHIGLNEPHDSFDSYAKVVRLDPVTKEIGQKYFSSKVELTEGVTLGMRHVFEAKSVILQVGGKKKSSIVRKIYEAQPSYALPATVVKLLNNAIVVLDNDAASEILDLLETE